MSFNTRAGTVAGMEDGLAALSRLVNTSVDLTDEDTGTVDSTYGAEEAAVLNNVRTRLGEIEAILVTLGVVNITADA